MRLFWCGVRPDLRGVESLQVMWRAIRPDLPENCPEKVDREFLHWILTTRRTQREKIAQTIADAPHLRVHHIRTAKGADTLLKWLRDDHQENR